MGVKEALLDFYKKEGQLEGQKEGHLEGQKEGVDYTLKIISMLKNGKTVSAIVNQLETSEAMVLEVKKALDL